MVVPSGSLHPSGMLWGVLPGCQSPIFTAHCQRRIFIGEMVASETSLMNVKKRFGKIKGLQGVWTGRNTPEISPLVTDYTKPEWAITLPWEWEGWAPQHPGSTHQGGGFWLSEAIAKVEPASKQLAYLSTYTGTPKTQTGTINFAEQFGFLSFANRHLLGKYPYNI